MLRRFAVWGVLGIVSACGGGSSGPRMDTGAYQDAQAVETHDSSSLDSSQPDSAGWDDRGGDRGPESARDLLDDEADRDAAAEDALRLDEGPPFDPEGPADADPGPPAPPPRPRITVNAIPDSMNGTTPFTQAGGPPQSFRLRVPAGGFSLDVYLDEPLDSTVDLRIQASRNVTLSGEVFEAGTDLAKVLGCGPIEDPMIDSWHDGLVARCIVPPGALPVTPEAVFTASFVAPDGLSGEADSIAVEVSTLPAYLDPFVSPDVWLVTLSRDQCDHVLMARPDGTYDIQTAFLPTGNGIADFDEALRLLGFLSQNAAWSEPARARFLGRIREYANVIYGLDSAGHPTPSGVPLSLFFEGDDGAPDAHAWSPIAGFSMIALGGDPNPGDIEAGIVGRAYLDWNNQGVEDNTGLDFGVFVTNIVRQVLRNPLGALILHEVSPLGGTPLGEYPGDEQFLDPAFDETQVQDERLAQRHAIFKTILDFASLAIAATLCHEMGHSLGLVPNGPPPEGLFGGMDDLNFTESNPGSAHIDTPGLNVMQTGRVTSYLDALQGVPHFNELNLAYLRRRLVVGTLHEAPTRAAPVAIACRAPLDGFLSAWGLGAHAAGLIGSRETNRTPAQPPITIRPPRMDEAVGTSPKQTSPRPYDRSGFR